VVIDYRAYGEHPERVPDLAAELVALKPDVVVAANPETVRAFMRSSDSLPIVMLGVTDPVGSGLIASYARPAGNITGTSKTSLAVKLLDLLQQLMPGLARVGFVFEPANPAGVNGLRDTRAAAQLTGVDVQAAAIVSSDELEAALDASLVGHPQAPITNANAAIINPNFPTIASFALQHGLPTASDIRANAFAGGLLYYGSPNAPVFRRAGSYYVDRILRGAKPADLPVEGPTVFELIVNRMTARALGIAFSPEFAAQVTEWID
jgi:putative ABC transport system substrate-binding protein